MSKILTKKSRSVDVSILVPTYNRIDSIKATIDSCLNQNGLDLEIIVVDNNSNDSSFEFLRSTYGNNSKVRLHQNKFNIGPVKNWEKCFSLSSGKFIKILFSDDIMEHDTCKVLYNELVKYQGAAYAFCNGFIFDVEKREKNPVYRSAMPYLMDYNQLVINSIKGLIPVSPSFMLIKRDALESTLYGKCNKYLPKDYYNYGAGIDMLMYLNPCFIGSKGIYVNKPLITAFQSKDSISVCNTNNRVTQTYQFTLIEVLCALGNPKISALYIAHQIAHFYNPKPIFFNIKRIVKLLNVKCLIFTLIYCSKLTLGKINKLLK